MEGAPSCTHPSAAAGAASRMTCKQDWSAHTSQQSCMDNRHTGCSHVIPGLTALHRHCCQSCCITIFFIQPPCHRLKRTWAALVAEEQPPTCGQPSPKEAPLADAPTPAEHPILPPLPLPPPHGRAPPRKRAPPRPAHHADLLRRHDIVHPTDQPCRLAILHPLWPRSPETLPPTAAPPPADLLARGSSPHDQVASTLPAPLHQRTWSLSRQGQHTAPPWPALPPMPSASAPQHPSSEAEDENLAEPGCPTSTKDKAACNPMAPSSS